MTSEAGKILIVDDDRDFVEALSAFLEAHHYVVLKAYDGREGLKLAKMQQPDLIVMDIIMKERTEGFFTVQEIRRIPELKTVPIFVLSSLYTQVTDFGIAPDRSWLGHDEFLAKPVNMSELLEKVQRHMEERCRNAEAPAGRKAES
jgi:twitching motility two-component system response regulator PilH